MIAEMMAQRLADTIPSIKAIRPMAAARHDQFPHVIYETVDLRNIRYLNCASKRYEGSVRFYVCGLDHADVIAITEALKDQMIGYSETGPAYRIRLCNVAGEGDVGQEEVEEGSAFYVKSVDVAVKALKL